MNEPTPTLKFRPDLNLYHLTASISPTVPTLDITLELSGGLSGAAVAPVLAELAEAMQEAARRPLARLVHGWERAKLEQRIQHWNGGSRLFSEPISLEEFDARWAESGLLL